MLTQSKQNEINYRFVKILKNVIEKNKIDNSSLLTQLYNFERGDIDDIKTKNILKIMMDVPYYEQNKNVNILRKFNIIKDTLVKIIDNNLSMRLVRLRK